MKIAICTEINFKPERGDKKSHAILAAGFKNVDLPVQEIADVINQGGTITAWHNGNRATKNFICAGFIAVDIDHGWKLDEVLALDYVNENGAIVYTTFNHKPTAHRLRIVFELERDITDPVEMTYAYQGITIQFSGDKACCAASQMFYGSKNSNPIVIGKRITNGELERLIQLGRDSNCDKLSDEIVDSGKYTSAGENGNDVKNSPGRSNATRSSITLKPNEPLQIQGGRWQNISEITVRTNVHCPNHLDKHASAFILTNRNGVKGVHCRSCNQSFWPEGHTRSALLDFDFFEFESHLDALEFDDDPNNYLDENAPTAYRADEMRSIQRIDKQHLPNLPLEDGVIFVRSPKGSGKTQWLKKIVAKCRCQDKSVLLIGHRMLLLREMARKLGLHFYKDKLSACDLDYRNEIFKNLAICVDSIPQMLNTMCDRYDVVIIDEVEQVFAHLTSKTLRDKRRPCYLKIDFFIRKAQSVIACDADLGHITVNTVGRMRTGNDPTKFYSNRYKVEASTIDIYDSKNHLIAVMKQIVMAGGRHYICCNSKKTAKMLQKILIDAGKSGDKMVLITAENSRTKNVNEFLNNISENILKYDVLIASPSLGTGIDITFGDNAELIDTVFGFFEGGITTHYDIDQQLSRVRHPKRVAVWVSPQKLYYEYEPEVIKENFRIGGMMSDALTGYDNNGKEIYAKDEPILDLVADVTMLANASKNNLKKHFVDLKKYNGWTVNYIAKEEYRCVETTNDIRKAKDEIENESIDAICNARNLTPDEYKELNKKEVSTNADFCALHKFRIGQFYGEDVTPELVKLDDKGKYRAKILMMVRFLSSKSVMIDRDFGNSDRLLFDRENNFQKSDLLRTLLATTGILDRDGTFNLKKEICSAELGKFSDACVEHNLSLQNLFNLPQPKDLFSKPMAHLTKILKLIGINTVKVRHTDNAEKKRTFFYAIDKTSHALAMHYAWPKVKSGDDIFEYVLDTETYELVTRFKKSKKVVRRF